MMESLVFSVFVPLTSLMLMKKSVSHVITIKSMFKAHILVNQEKELEFLKISIDF